MSEYASLHTKIVTAIVCAAVGLIGFSWVQSAVDEQLNHVSSCIDSIGMANQTQACQEIG